MTTSPSIADANSTVLPPAVLKPTSRDGQQETSLELWTAPDGLCETGVWECSPGTFTATRDGYDEVAIILSGRATVVDAEGQSTELTPGSVFVTPAGWTGTWTLHETMRKSYVIRQVSAR